MTDIDVIREWAESDIRAIYAFRERQIQLSLQPRPKWMPVWLWKKMISRLLVIVERASE